MHITKGLLCIYVYCNVRNNSLDPLMHMRMKEMILVYKLLTFDLNNDEVRATFECTYVHAIRMIDKYCRNRRKESP